jgi:hypothetical protein
MNERIRELAEQAGPNIVKEFDQEDIDFCKKFAELIVRECTNMLPEDSIRDANGVHMFYVIRKHFGVSEIGR